MDAAIGKECGMSLKTRLSRLEREQTQISREPFRVVVSRAGEPFDLAKATCTRTIMQNGQLMELVNLNGSRESLSDDDLERFIQSFPIEGRL
jgi:hypothetical protein